VPHALVIAGATGLVGGAAVRYALDRGHRVIALTRAGQAQAFDRGLVGRGLVPLEVDFNDMDCWRGEVGRHAPTSFLCALGTTIRRAGSQAAFAKVDHDYVVAFARLGRAVGTRHFGLVSSVGADPAGRAFYLRTKGEAEESVKALGYERLDIARPSFLIGERKEARSGEGWGIRISKLIAPALVGPLSIYRPIEAAAVARALVNLSERPEAGVFVHHYDELRAAG
jgi:uncharacterized protein YbjT (DUF2867 family)